MKPIVPAFTAAPKKENQVEISTLGRFMIKRGDVILSDSLHRSRKVWELFKFLMTNRHRAALPEEALETLWPEQDYGNPNLAMRSLIFRLRRLLEQIGVPDLASGIVYAQGCYRWAAKPGCRLEDVYKRQEVRDMLAAVLILESFLNSAAGPNRQ